MAAMPAPRRNLRRSTLTDFGVTSAYVRFTGLLRRHYFPFGRESLTPLIMLRFALEIGWRCLRSLQEIEVVDKDFR